MIDRAPGSFTSRDMEAGLVGRAQRTRHPDLPGRVLLHPLVCRLAGPASRGDVHLPGQVLGAVVGLGDAVGVERVRLDDIRAGGQVLPVDGDHHLGLAQVQDLVVALEILRVIAEALAAEVSLLATAGPA